MMNYFSRIRIPSILPCCLRGRKFWIGGVRSLWKGNDSDFPIELSYSREEATTDHEHSTIVFIHGLFGNRKNWNALAKRFHQQTGREVLTLDLRNHGESGHSEVMTFEALVNDLDYTLSSLGIYKPIICGHSFGGKVAMSYSLYYPNNVEGLIIVDVTPTKSKLHTDISKALKAMMTMDLQRVETRKDAEKHMKKKYTSNDQMCQFLLTNLISGKDGYEWRINLDGINKNINTIIGFPLFKLEQYKRNTLFIGGANSYYIQEDDYPEMRRLFPNSEVVFIPGAGHWVHSDKPFELIKLISSFLKMQD